jgi:hypothetical protein
MLGGLMVVRWQELIPATKIGALNQKHPIKTTVPKPTLKIIIEKVCVHH